MRQDALASWRPEAAFLGLHGPQKRSRRRDWHLPRRRPRGSLPGPFRRRAARAALVRKNLLLAVRPPACYTRRVAATPKPGYTKNGKKIGRKLKVIDPNQVIALARMNGSYAEIAAVIGCDPETIRKRFSEEVNAGRDHLKMSLKRWQYIAASKGNVTMLIWLGKNILGQSDNAPIEDYVKRKPVTAEYIESVKIALGITGKLVPLVERSNVMEINDRSKLLPD